MTIDEIKKILQQNKIYPSKIKGQNFLIEEKIAQRLVEAADIRPTDSIIEVGPGLGIITQFLAQTKAKIYAYELDVQVIPYLQKKFQKYSNLQIIHQDIRQLFYQKKFPFENQQYKIVANLPYYLTNYFLKLFLNAQNKPSIACLLIQKEVAERITAQNGKQSLLSLSVHLYADAEIIEPSLPSSAFYPSPQVSGAILKIKVLPKVRLKIDNLATFFRLLKIGFSSKRKQLHNNLAVGFHLSSLQAKKIIERAGLDPAQRPETLSLKDWQKLSQKLSTPN